MNKNSNFKTIWIAIIIIVLDQATKLMILSKLTVGKAITILPILDFNLVYNQGTAFGLLGQAGGWQNWMFLIFAAIISIFIIWWLATTTKKDYFLILAYNLILGGAIGNLLNRIMFGRVIDFIYFHWHSFQWPSFNIADSAVVLGAIILIFKMAKKEQKQ